MVCRIIEGCFNGINCELHSRIPPKIRKGQHRLAIDLHLTPYDGVLTEAEASYVYRSQAKAGTTRFFAYATVYVIRTTTKNPTLRFLFVALAFILLN